MDRRHFLKTLGIGASAAMAGIPLMALRDAGVRRVRILHTNDTHSRIDPFPGNDPRYPAMGGYARRASMIRAYREEDPGLVLLDAGDIFQGTPYYNLYGGEPELRLMSKMGYDAAAFGNHEFDNGLEGFAAVRPFAAFPFLAANYDFSQTVLADKVESHMLLNRNGLKIGIYGLGIKPSGLVGRSLYGDTKYIDPIEVAREQEQVLHSRHRCDLIICLSHLGYEYRDDRIGDTMVASHTKHTDIIIGGHTHRLLDPPATAINENGQTVYIGQAGSGGVHMGCMDVMVIPISNEKLVDSNTTNI